MQAANAAEDRVTDIATTIAVTMRQMGVLGLPRNYEIFYEALTGSNHALSLEVVSLGDRPTQEELDKIGRKFFAQNHGHGIVENARELIAKELEEIASIIRNERHHLEKYGKILGETSDGLANRDMVTKDLLQKIVSVMTVATNSTIEHGNHAANSLGDKSAELETMKSKLEEYKKLADTDPLTHIWNRRAFDRRIAKIYDNSTGILFNALILADIDRFKEDQRPLRPSQSATGSCRSSRKSCVKTSVRMRLLPGPAARNSLSSSKAPAKRRLSNWRTESATRSIRHRSATFRPARTMVRSPSPSAYAWPRKPTDPRTFTQKPTAPCIAPRSAAETR